MANPTPPTYPVVPASPLSTHKAPPIAFSDHRHHSTPQSRGNAAHAEYHLDHRTTNLQNIDNVEHDLKDTKRVAFRTMVEGFIMREKLGPVNSNVLDQTSLKVCEEDVGREFVSKVKDAVVFCNKAVVPEVLPEPSKDETRHCGEIKYHLNQYCGKSKETSRYVPLVNALNAILSWASKDKPRVIFVVNDPVIIHSPYLENAPKRKPDIILVTLDTFKQWYSLGDVTFDRCRRMAAHPQELSAAVPRTWSDVIQFWELKAEDVEPSAVDILQQYSDNGITKSTIRQSTLGTTASPAAASSEPRTDAAKSSTTGVTSQSSAAFFGSSTARGSSVGVKRRPSETETLVVKRSRTSRPKISPAVQCAYYAIERFRSSWKVSHVSGIYLKDCSLEVLWYDSQGCIRSYALDIVRQLPLLVVLIAVQHSSPYLPGLVTQDIPEKYQEVDEIARRFQLVGRMTYCAYLVETPATAPTTSATGRPLRAKSAAQLPQQTRNDASHFFKVSWPEDDRLTHKSEGEIIKEARARADALPEELRKIVTEHIPDVREQGVIPNSSTAIIRTIFGLNTAGSRSQYWMVSKKLLSLSSILDDFNVFKRVYWEFIRCHRLLWALGIVHGDISFNNLMYVEDDEGNKRGILNDFDLASIVVPGTECPSKIGHRRTGTLVFMALELLDSLDGEIPRHYRHELESFVWVLLWAGLLHQVDQKLCRSPRHILDWVDLDPNNVYEKKSAFLGRFRKNLSGMTETQSPYYQVLHDSLVSLNKMSADSNLFLDETAKNIKQDHSREDQLLSDLIKAWKVDRGRWMDFKAPANTS